MALRAIKKVKLDGERAGRRLLVSDRPRLALQSEFRTSGRRAIDGGIIARCATINMVGTAARRGAQTRGQAPKKFFSTIVFAVFLKSGLWDLFLGKSLLIVFEEIFLRQAAGAYRP